MSSGPTRIGSRDSGRVRRASGGLLGGLVVFSGLASGCGQSTYAERIDRTAKVFAYQNRLDQNLQAEWTRGDWGLSLRVPVRFRLIPPPPPPMTNEEGVTEAVVDPRQPPYLGVELPGLVAAWEVPGEAFLYLCSNHQRFIDSQANAGGGDPDAFLTDLEGVLQQAFKFTLAEQPARGPTELHAKFAERIPPSDEFAPPNSFQSIRIEKPGDPNDPADPAFSASVFELNADKIQVALILVYSPANPGNFDTSVRIALETLRVSPAIPRGAVAPGTPAAPNTGGQQAF